MKKIYVIIFFFLLNTFTFPNELLKVGAYTAYFSPRNDTLKNIYSGGDIIYGLKLGVHAWRGLYVFLSGLQYKQAAETIPLGDVTRLTLNPIILSLRYTFSLGTVNPYVEGGYTHLYFKEESDIGDVKDQGSGYVLDTGVELRISPRFVIDLGARYSQVKVSPTGFAVELGGLHIGITFLVII